jgi:hypothetical protein
MLRPALVPGLVLLLLSSVYALAQGPCPTANSTIANVSFGEGFDLHRPRGLRRRWPGRWQSRRAPGRTDKKPVSIFRLQSGKVLAPYRRNREIGIQLSQLPITPASGLIFSRSFW